MTAPTDPRLFEHLLDRTGWMRSLARELCADRAVADDIVQDAWLAALEHPPREPGAARAWIGRVIANLTHARQRSESARSARQELVARRESVASTADVVERAEIGKKLAECVLALDEPYRSTVLSRYFDGLSAEEIAARERVSSSTVRTRLARGLAMLRERLERRDGRSWMSAMALLARARPGAAAASAATAGAVASTQLVPVIVMSTLAKIGIGVGIVALAAWMLWPRSAEPTHVAEHVHASSSQAQLQTEGSAEASQRVAMISRDTTSATRPTIPNPTTTSKPGKKGIDEMTVEVPPATIEGIVLRGRTPVARCKVYAWPDRALLPEHPERGPTNASERESWATLLHTTTDSVGLFRFEQVHTDTWDGFRYTLGVDVGDGIRAETDVRPLADQPGKRIVIQLGSSIIQGHVYDDDGAPRANARVVLTENRAFKSWFSTARNTDASGAFEIAGLAAGAYGISVFFEERVWGTPPRFSRNLVPSLGEGETRTVDVGTHARAVVWTGTLRTRAGSIVPGPAQLLFTGRHSSISSRTNLEPDGSFHVRLRADTYEVVVAELICGRAAVQLDPVTIAHADIERDIVLPGTRLRVSLVDADTGQSLSPRPESVTVWIHPQGQNHPGAFALTDARADGSCCFESLTAGDWIVELTGAISRDRRPSPVHVTVLDSDLEVPVRIALHAP
jgi:RNA polymerase sigma factor (sigma-70 family)